jgi:hypothetical protein
MPTFELSPASPIHFAFETSGSAIRTGESIADNYLFTDSGIEDFYNCNKLERTEWCQPYNCDDTTSFQFQWEVTDKWPEIIVKDQDDAQVGTLFAEWIAQDTDGVDYYNVDIDFSNYDCGDCLTIEINSLDMDTSESTCWSDEGGANWQDGGSNTGSSEVTLVRTGAVATRTTAPGVPVAIDRTIGYCDNLTFSANTYYMIEIYIYEVDSSSSFSNGIDIELDVTTDLSDATVLAQQTANPAVDGYGTWHAVRTVFKTGADTTGNIYLRLETSTAPQANGYVISDDLVFKSVSGSPLLEATSDQICLATNHECSLLLRYTSDEDAYGIHYPTTVADRPVHYLRLRAQYHQFELRDPEHETPDDASNTARVQYSRPQKIHTLRTDALPPYMITALLFAAKHPDFKIDGVNYICVTQNLAPEWEPELFMQARVDLEMRLEAYPFSFAKCQ